MKHGKSQIFTSDSQLVAIKWRDKHSVHLSNLHHPDNFTPGKIKQDWLRMFLAQLPLSITTII